MSRHAAATAEKLETPEHEPALALRAQQGDPQAFVELYRRHKGPLYRHAYRMLRSEAAAHDVVQESFVRAISAIGRTREELRFKAWIFRIATNLCLRQLTVRTRWVSNEGAPAAESTEARSDPERQRRRVELAHFVAAALEATPAQYRQILLLRELEELSYEELAQVLATNVPRVKVTLHRARSRFGAEFVAAQLEADPTQPIACDELAGLVAAQAERRELVRHLESCKTCRQRERRPAAELFTFLPAIIEPPALATPPAVPPAAAPPVVATTAGGSGLGLGSAALLGVGLVGLVAGLWMGRHTVTPPPRRATPAPQVRPAMMPRAARPSVVVRPLARPAAATHSPRARRQHGQRISVAALTRSRAHVSAKSQMPRRLGPTSASKPVAKSSPKSVAIGDSSWTQRPLQLWLALAAAPVEVQRGKQRFLLRTREQLRPGDVLSVQGGGSFGLRLAGDQWIGVGGTLRLERIARRGDNAERIRVALLSGWLRGKATRRGRGLAVRVGKRVVSVDSGELRLRRRAKDFRLETLGAYATVTGGMVVRNVSPQTGVSLSLDGKDDGGSSGLLAAPTGLRPTRARGMDAPRLSWSAVPGAAHYVVQLARDTDFIAVVQTLRTQKVFVTPTGLVPGRYYWQVVAVDAGLQGRPSKIFRFVVLERD